MIKLGLIGYGYWGPNLFRNFQKLENCEINYIIDSDLSKLNELKEKYPKLHVSHLLAIRKIDDFLKRTKFILEDKK